MQIYRSVSGSSLAGAGVTVAGVGVLVAVLAPWHDELGLMNAGLIFLLFVLSAAAIWGRSVGIFAALVANLALNFFFIEPLHTLTVARGQNVVALLVFLAVSIIGGTLVSSARAAAAAARRRENETQVLLRLSRAMIGRTDPREALRACCRELDRAFDAAGSAVLNRTDGEWAVIASGREGNAERAPDAQECFMADKAAASGVMTGLGHTGLLSRRALRIVNPLSRMHHPSRQDGVAFVPLRVADRTLGVMRVDGPILNEEMRSQAPQLLPAFAGEAALGLQRVELAAAAAHADALQRADEMKSLLLASISHDLKTPIAGIKTAATSLGDPAIEWSPSDRAIFLETIETQADRLDRVISDMLDLTRIEAGALNPTLCAMAASELIQEAIDRASDAMDTRTVEVDVENGLEVVTDELLMTQALANLLENAAKYSTAGMPVRVRCLATDRGAEIRVEDTGRGIDPRDLPFVFDRFYRGRESSGRAKGSGLGLAIVRGFVERCGGSVRAERHTSGTHFVVTLPAPVATAVPA